jgi:hypothetical protein
MPPIRDLLWGIVYPALAAGCTWAFLGGAWFKKDARWVSSAAIAVAFVIAYIGLLQGPPLHPTGAREWLFWIAAGGAAVSPLEKLVRGKAFIVRLAYTGALLWLVLERQHANHWSPDSGGSPFPDVALCLALALLGWSAVEYMAKRAPGAGVPLAMWAMAAGLALCSLWSSSGLYAQLAGAIAGALGAAVVLAWLRPGTWFAGGGAGVAFVMLFAIGVAAHYYADLDTTSALLLASAPLAALLADLPPLAAKRPAVRVVLRLGLVLIPLALAAQRTYTSYAAHSDGPGGGPDSYGY